MYIIESNITDDKDNDEMETDDSISSKTDLRNEHEDTSYETINNVFNTTTSPHENRILMNEFRTKPFKELKSFVNEKQKQTDYRIEQVLNVRYLPEGKSSNSNSTLNENSRIEINNLNYPDLFTY